MAVEGASGDSVIVRDLGCVDYPHAWQLMQRFTDRRDAATADEIWCLQHPPVFTQGQAGKAEHVLDAGDIPVIHSDRGGQVTYHGPGQLVVYLLVDLRRKNLGVRALVDLIEAALIDLLARYGVVAIADPKAPGVYVRGRKIASLGLRVRHGCSFHGLALNVDVDLAPFERINPCGYAGLAMTRLVDEVAAGTATDMPGVCACLVEQLVTRLAYNRAHHETHPPAA